MQIAYDFKKYILVKLNELTKFFRVKEDDVSTESLVIMADEIYKNLSADQFNFAFDKIKLNWKPEFGVKFPFLQDFMTLVMGKPQDRANLAWEAVLKAISSHGAYASIDFGDAAIHRTVKRFGGWPAVCQWETESLAFIEREFKSSYMANISAPATGEECEHLPGLHEAMNQNNGFPVPTPVRIQIHATPVYALGSDTKKINFPQLLKSKEAAQ